MESNKISIIQGDSVDVEVTIDDLSACDEIENIYFSCAKFPEGMKSKPLSKNETLTKPIWTLSFTAEQTGVPPKGNYEYDLTIKFKNGNIMTVIYQGDLVVFEKTNTVNYEA